MKPNEWLQDKEFLSKVIFYDKYYFQSLCIRISDFLKNIPIPVVTNWDYKNNKIHFYVGELSNAFVVDTNIAYKDYITLVERWLEQFYPTYSVEFKIEVPLTDKEVLEKVENKNMKLNDAIQLKKKVKYKEEAMIERVYFLEDTFKIKINKDVYLYLSGTPDNIYPISRFLKDLKKMGGDDERRTFIKDNSTEKANWTDKVTVNEEIHYLGMQMKNFVEINYPDMARCTFKKLERRKWKWGIYTLFFETDILEYDVLDSLRKKGAKIKDEGV